MKIRNLFKKIYGYFRELGHLTPIAFVTTFLPIAGSAILLTIAIPLGYWLRDNWQEGMPYYLLGVLVFCGLSLLPTNVIGVLGGFAFGFELGIIVLITGIVGAATLSFLIHNKIVGDKLPQVFGAHPRAKAVYEALVGQNAWRSTLIIFLLRLSPAMPFALTNFLMASARVSLKSYVAGTFLGMLPRSSAVIFVGSGLSELNFDNPGNTWLLVFGIAATIITVVILSRIAKRALDHITNPNQAA